ncbi:uncharacterized protein LODBEIA_P15740 [Lodderomyces beijingensis]|uniref:Uncharacterized protein n=1 Tax=Lodderomyces beijingensis TaxID=1775926 RepID=A0ABP0ZM39_9ASCO
MSGPSANDLVQTQSSKSTPPKAYPNYSTKSNITSSNTTTIASSRADNQSLQPLPPRSASDREILNSLKHSFKVDSGQYKHYEHQASMSSHSIQDLIDNSDNETNGAAMAGSARGLINQKLSELLDVPLQETKELPWPYNTENLGDLIKLQTEKEKTRQWEMKMDLGAKTTELLQLAKELGVDPDLIPLIFLSESVSSEHVSGQIIKLKAKPEEFVAQLSERSHKFHHQHHHTSDSHNIKRKHADTLLPSFSETTQSIQANGSLVSPLRSPDKSPVLAHRRIVSDGSDSSAGSILKTFVRERSSVDEAGTTTATATAHAPPNVSQANAMQKLDAQKNQGSPVHLRSSQHSPILSFPSHLVTSTQYPSYYPIPQAIPQPPPVPQTQHLPQPTPSSHLHRKSSALELESPYSRKRALSYQPIYPAATTNPTTTASTSSSQKQQPSLYASSSPPATANATATTNIHSYAAPGTHRFNSVPATTPAQQAGPIFASVSHSPQPYAPPQALPPAPYPPASSSSQKHKPQVPQVPSHHFEVPDSSKSVFKLERDLSPPTKKPKNGKGTANINFMITTPKNPPARKYNIPSKEK